MDILVKHQQSAGGAFSWNRNPFNFQATESESKNWNQNPFIYLIVICLWLGIGIDLIFLPQNRNQFHFLPGNRNLITRWEKVSSAHSRVYRGEFGRVLSASNYITLPAEVCKGLTSAEGARFTLYRQHFMRVYVD